MPARHRLNEIITPLSQPINFSYYQTYITRLSTQVWRQFIDHKCVQQASSLAFNTLVCLVPLSAFILFLLKMLGVVENEGIVFMDNFLPGNQASEITSKVAAFANRNLGSLGAGGFFLLLLTSTALFNSVEKVFDDIWGTHRQLSFFQKYAVFYTILTIGSLLILMWISTFLAARKGIVTNLLPWVLVYCIFLFVYLALPNTVVQWKAALMGAVVAGTLFQIARIAFTKYLSVMGRNYSEIYGVLAFPLILAIWIYIVWVIVLLGTEITNVAQSLTNNGSRGVARSAIPIVADERLVFVNAVFAIELFLTIARHFYQGNGAYSKSDMMSKYGLSQDLVSRVFKRLEDAELVYKVEGQIDGYVPARALSTITLEQVVDAFESNLDRLSEVTDELSNQLFTARCEILCNRSIEELITSKGDVKIPPLNYPQ